MKALQKSPIPGDQSFECRLLRAPHFDPNWHFHSEYQLFVVLQGTGTRFIGDHVHPFKPGDMVFTGPNLPHLWRSDPEYFEGLADVDTEGIVVYFSEDFPGKDLLQKRELYRIRQLFTMAQRGMEVQGKTREKVTKMMRALPQARDFDGILLLFEILNTLADTAEFSLLADAEYINLLKPSDTERMNTVHAHVMKNFREKITLDEVSALANMSASAFSRYFKTHANKTFSEFLTEIRVRYACKLLIERKISVAQACFDSGFNTVSNFNRQFKAVTHYTPLAYRNKYQETNAGTF